MNSNGKFMEDQKQPWKACFKKPEFQVFYIYGIFFLWLLPQLDNATRPSKIRIDWEEAAARLGL